MLHRTLKASKEFKIQNTSSEFEIYCRVSLRTFSYYYLRTCGRCRMFMSWAEVQRSQRLHP